MTGDTSSLVLLVLGIIFAIVKLFDYFAKSKSNKEILEKIEELSELTQKIHVISSDLSSVHNIRDEDGVPLIYVPRSLGRDQKRIAEIIQGMVFTLESMLRELQKQ